MTKNIFNEAYLERKKESFAALKRWDDRRTQFLIAHKNLLENIITRLDKKAKMSMDGIVTVSKFFKERAAQEHDYAKLYQNKVPSLSQLFKDVSDSNKLSMYAGLSDGLKECDEFHVKMLKNIQLFEG